MIFFFNNSKAYHFCLNQIILSGSLNFKYLNKQIKKTFLTSLNFINKDPIVFIEISTLFKRLLNQL